MKVKSYLHEEGQRNRVNAALYERLIKAAFGQHVPVMVGHHLAFESDGTLASENEIPAADTLLFDHQIMGATFGAQALDVMRQLCAVPAEQRDALVTTILSEMDRLAAIVPPVRARKATFEVG